VLSAAFVRLFNIPTVSFHMGDEACTIDLQTKSVSHRQMEQAEQLANDVINEDRPVDIRFHTAAEAQSMGVRKIPDTDRDRLRLIDIRDFDLTACGGTHVRSTGQIGAILLRKSENVKQGVRVEFVCGGRAIRTARRDYRTLLESAAIFSTHIWELPQQIRKSQEEAKTNARAQQRLLEEVAALHAQQMLAGGSAENGRKIIVSAIKDRELAFVRLLAQKIAAAGEPAVALLGATVGQPTLVFAQSAGQSSDMGALLKQTTAAFGGRGGGSKDFAQGGVPEAAAIDAALQSALRTLRG
jgi:alanyl-tRNA synthetase